MRITRDLLHKFATQTVKQRKRSEPDLHAVYLTGSLLSKAPMLGGTTDIDLILVHKYQAPVHREVVSITPEISVDIFHKIKDDYIQHRKLRHDAFIGYPLTYNHILLFDSDHWLEFIQASVSAEFHRADNVLARVNNLSSTARENWFSLTQSTPKTHLVWLKEYLEIIVLAANAVSGLIGPPLTNRRFMPTFRLRTEDLGAEHVFDTFVDLLGLFEADGEVIINWINAFEQDLQFLAESTSPPVHLSPCRHPYYLEAFKAFVETDIPIHAAWPLLRTWLDLQLAVPQPSPSVTTWAECLTTLNLTEDVIPQKIEALDAFLDIVEELIETWSTIYGY